MSWHVIIVSTLEPNLSNVPYVSDLLLAAITWRFTWSDTCRKTNRSQSTHDIETENSLMLLLSGAIRCDAMWRDERFMHSHNDAACVPEINYHNENNCVLPLTNINWCLFYSFVINEYQMNLQMWQKMNETKIYFLSNKHRSTIFYFVKKKSSNLKCMSTFRYVNASPIRFDRSFTAVGRQFMPLYYPCCRREKKTF